MDENYKKDMICAGRIAAQVRDYGASLLVPGSTYMSVVEKIRKKILKLGAIPAFPPQIAPNEIAAHYFPLPGDDITFTDQVLSLDVGVCVNGAIGDTAITVDLSGKNRALVLASQYALDEVLTILKVGLPIRAIGKKIDEVCNAQGFTSVRNLSGHGLGMYQVHTAPNIPNYDNANNHVIEPGMTFAIEPFCTTGKGLIYDAGNPVIFSFARACAVRSPFAKECLKKIKTFNGLPFVLHDLIDESLTFAKVRLGMSELVRLGVVTGHAPLIEQAKGLVSQAEHTVLIDEDGTVIVTTLSSE